MNLYITKEELLALTVGSLKMGESFEYGITQDELERFTSEFRNIIYEVKSDFTICFDMPCGNKIFKDDYWRENFRFFLDKYTPNSYENDIAKDNYKDFILIEVERVIIDLVKLGIPEEVARKAVNRARMEFITRHYEEIDLKNRVDIVPFKENNIHHNRTKRRFFKKGKRA